MMKSVLYKPSFFSGKQKGSSFILGACYISALLAAMTLAIDIGQLYRQQIYTQKAADAAVLAGIGHSIFNRDVLNEGEDGDPTPKEKIEYRAKEALNENLMLNGLQQGVGGASVNYDIATFTLTVTASSKPRYLVGLFKALLPDKLDAIASARRKPANIHLILDYSSSMDCPVGNTCNCITSGGALSCADEAGGSENQKISHLKNAVISFLDHFDPDFDRIGLTLYNTGAEVVVPIAGIDYQGFDRNGMISIINSRSAAGNTNPSAALLEAYRDMERSGIINNPAAPNEEATYVVFSDGPPTAARFLLGSPQPGLDENASPGEFDYSHFALQWSSGRGPSMLIKSQAVLFGADEMSDIEAGFTPNSPSACKLHAEPPASTADYEKVFSDCLTDLGFTMPGDPNTVYGKNCGSTALFNDCYFQQYYHVLVQLSDHLRKKQGIIYVIGLGNKKPVSADPYQDIEDMVSMKPVLLSKMANDYYQGVDLATQETGSPYPAFSQYPEYAPYTSLSTSPRPKIGRFSSSPDATQLKELFNTVAAKILLRLST